MDIASILGVVTALAAMVYAVLAGGGSAGAFIDYPSLACVGGGSIAALLMCYPLKNVMTIGKVYKVVFVNQLPDVPAVIETLVSLSETARREGLLALENKIGSLKDPFIVLGIQMAVDGTRPEIIEEVLRTEIESKAMRHSVGKGLIDQLGKYGPAFGMIGTLLGLVIMLGNMSDPNSIGPGMAVALLTTLYGALLANAICLPFAEKLNFLNKQELLAMEIVLKGIMAIQSGDNPRVIQQKLNMYLPPKARTRGFKAA
ncbi:MAG: motility protein A [Planctomycetia bacterium]|nr:motility protein A [Planctomycetia bacterium]